MLKEQDLLKAHEFANRCIMASSNLVQEKNTFSQSVLKALSEVFGYNTTIMGILPDVERGTLFSAMVYNGVDMAFVQDISNCFDVLERHISTESAFVLSNAKFIGSNSIYSVLQKRYGFEDMMIKFVKSPATNKPCCYIIRFADKRITPYDVELMDYIEKTIGSTYHVVLKLWNLNNRHEMLLNSINYFPVGILMLTALNNVVYVNDVAESYLRELGVTDPRLYGTFYENELYGYHQHSALRFGQSRPMRYKGFLINIIFSSDPATSLSAELSMIEKDRYSRDDDKMESYRGMFEKMAVCIYIIRADVWNTRFSQSTLDHFKFSNRECEIIELIAEGLSNNEIAEKMDIKFNTARIHISNIFKKANVLSRVELLNKLYSYETSNMIRENV